MKINPNGTFSLEKGEQIPFICPKCFYPIEYLQNVWMVNCTNCQYIGQREEFIKDVYMKDNK